MKVLYITYENLYKTAILQAMVIKPLDLMSKKYRINFTITSSVKDFEFDEIYFKNKQNIENNTNLKIKEFRKKLTRKQSLFTFFVDIIPMIIFSIKEAKKSDIIHCRSYGGAMIGYIASIFSGKPFIFDMRGVLPEETVDVGKLTTTSIKFKLLKFTEKLLIKKAAYVFTVSERFNIYIKNNFNKNKCININNPTDFNMYYKKIKDKKRVNFIYSGSMQVWHLPELTIEYFAEIQKTYSNKVYLYFCTNDIGKAELIFEKFRIPKESYEINTVTFDKMPEYYAQSDIAFCFIKESFSKSVCFPVKFSEYIASNLLILGNKNIGDIDNIINKYNCGLVFSNLNKKSDNLVKIYKLINEVLNKNTTTHYNREDLKFLDWNRDGINSIYEIYKKLGEKIR